MKNKIEVETTVKELCPKTDGNYVYINLYQKAIICDKKKQIPNALIEQNKEALSFVEENIKK